jgi:hypothetical protein
MTAIATTPFLNLVDPGVKFREIANFAAKAAESSDDLRKDFASIASWWGKTYDQPERLLSILYLRAQEELRDSPISSAKEFAKRTKHARAVLASFDQKAIRQDLAETESAIRNSTFLSRKLELAEQELAELTSDFEEVARKVVPQLQDATLTRTAAGDVSTQRWSCTLNGAPISCWLALAIVVVAVILL